MHHQTQSSVFDWLNNLTRMNDSDIESQLSTQNAVLLNQIVQSLADQACLEKTIVRQENFVAIIRYMHELYKSGSRDLGTTMIEAEGLLKDGKKQAAQEKYLEFLARCKSSFHRNIAQTQLTKLVRE